MVGFPIYFKMVTLYILEQWDTPWWNVLQNGIWQKIYSAGNETFVCIFAKKLTKVKTFLICFKEQEKSPIWNMDGSLTWGVITLNFQPQGFLYMGKKTFLYKRKSNLLVNTSSITVFNFFKLDSCFKYLCFFTTQFKRFQKICYWQVAL